MSSHSASSLSSVAPAELGLNMEDALTAARRDTSLFYALEVLASCDYNADEALQTLIKQPPEVCAEL